MNIRKFALVLLLCCTLFVTMAAAESVCITIPQNTVTIEESAFDTNPAITEVVMPESVKTIGAFAFADCVNLMKVTIPGMNVTIDRSAFVGCPADMVIWCHRGSTVDTFATTRGLRVRYLGEPAPTPGPVKSIQISGNTTIEGCSRSQLSVQVLPADAANRDVTWSTSDSTIAVVSSGLVTGKKPGTATITATAKDGSGVSASVTVTVKAVPVTAMSMDPDAEDIYVNLGETIQIVYALYPANHTNNTFYNTRRDLKCFTSSFSWPAHDQAVITLTATAVGDEVLEANPTNVNATLARSVRLHVVDPNPAPGEPCGDDVYWKMDGDTLYIMGSGDMDSFATTDRPWPSSVRHCVIEEGVTSIGVSAFDGCDELVDIVIPNSVKSIGDYSFYECEKLTNIAFPPAITRINEYAFYGCRALTSVLIPNGIAAIGDYAFSHCSGLTEISIPGTVSAIGAYAFDHCVCVKKVTIADSSTKLTIGTYGLNNLDDDPVMILPARISSLGNRAIDATAIVTAPVGSVAYNYCIQNDIALSTAATIPVTGVTLNRSALTLSKGGTATLTASVSPSNATNKSVTWTSSNTAVASVNTTGVVTARGGGTATITATAADGSGRKATCTVSVPIDDEDITPTQILVTSITLSKTSATLNIGDTLTLTKTVLPSNATEQGVTWSTGNSTVATVGTTGVVTAKAAGTATITATAKDGSGKKATCTITVRANDETQPIEPPACVVTLDHPDLTGDTLNMSPLARVNDGINPIISSNYSWTAALTDVTGSQWVRLEKTSGSAGENRMTMTLLKKPAAGNTYKSRITITAGNRTFTYYVQLTIPAARFVNTPSVSGGTYEGDNYTLSFTTTSSVERVVLCYVENGVTKESGKSFDAWGNTSTLSNGNRQWSVTCTFENTGADTRTVLVRCYDEQGNVGETKESGTFTCKRKTTDDAYYGSKAVAARIDDLANKLCSQGPGYFTVSSRPCNQEFKYSHSCANCYNASVLKASWFTPIFGNGIPTSAFPRAYDSAVNMWTQEGWSCYGFAMFAEYWLYRDPKNPGGKVSVDYIGSYTYNAENAKKYVKPGDVLCLDDHHFLICKAVTNTGIVGLDSNGESGTNMQCRVRLTETPWSWYSSFTISRATNAAD